MYPDRKDKTIEDLQYLVDLAADTEDRTDRVTVLKKAERLIRIIIDRTEAGEA